MRQPSFKVLLFLIGMVFIALDSKAESNPEGPSFLKSDRSKKRHQTIVQKKNSHVQPNQPGMSRHEHNRLKLGPTIMLLNPLFAHFRFFTPTIQITDTLDA